MKSSCRSTSFLGSFRLLVKLADDRALGFALAYGDVTRLAFAEFSTELLLGYISYIVDYGEYW